MEPDPNPYAASRKRHRRSPVDGQQGTIGLIRVVSELTLAIISIPVAWGFAYCLGYWTCFIYHIDLGDNDFAGLAYMCAEGFLAFVTLLFLITLFTFAQIASRRWLAWIARTGAIAMLVVVVIGYLVRQASA